jgi:hypothetical protein
VWSKSAHKLVQDKWYKAGDYHVEKGEGHDFYHVGKTRGCGGWVSTMARLCTPRRTTQAGRFSPMARFAPSLNCASTHGMDGRKVAETRRVSLDAGSNFSR